MPICHDTRMKRANTDYTLTLEDTGVVMADNPDLCADLSKESGVIDKFHKFVLEYNTGHMISAQDLAHNHELARKYIIELEEEFRQFIKKQEK